MIFLVLGVLFLVLGFGLGGAAFFIDNPSADDEAFMGLAITGGTFLIIGAVFTIVGAVSARSGARKQRIRTTGVRGTATITEIDETTMTVNDRPVLNISFTVTVPGRSPYPLKQRMVMPWSAIGRLAVGATVPVMVDPADPDSVVVEWSAPAAVPDQVDAGTPQWAGAPLAAAQANTLSGVGSMPAVPNQLSGSPGSPDAILQYLRTMGVDISGPIGAMITGAISANAAAFSAQDWSVPGQAMAAGQTPVPGASAVPPMSAAPVGAVPAGPLDIRADASELRKTGRPGRATVRSTQDLGVEVGGKRLLRLDLEVAPDGGPPYPLQHVTMVPEATIPRISPGASVAVHLDPTNAQNLEIDWDGA